MLCAPLRPSPMQKAPLTHTHTCGQVGHRRLVDTPLRGRRAGPPPLPLGYVGRLPPPPSEPMEIGAPRSEAALALSSAEAATFARVSR